MQQHRHRHPQKSVPGSAGRRPSRERALPWALAPVTRRAPEIRFGTIQVVPLLLMNRFGVTEGNLGYFVMYFGGMGLLVRSLLLGLFNRVSGLSTRLVPS